MPGTDCSDYWLQGQSSPSNIGALCIIGRQDCWEQSYSVLACTCAHFIADFDECAKARVVGAKHISIERGERTCRGLFNHSSNDDKEVPRGPISIDNQRNPKKRC